MIHWRDLRDSDAAALDEAMQVQRICRVPFGTSRRFPRRVLLRLARMGLVEETQGACSTYPHTFPHFYKCVHNRRCFRVTKLGVHVWKYRVSDVPFGLWQRQSA